MPRYKLTIEYDGSPFVGWQAQTNGRSVQQVLEEGIKGFCGQELKIFGAGRTDAGVHALGQVAHVDFETPVAPDTLRDAVNAHMRPHPVAIVEAEEVPDSFEARFSAVKRHYMYRIVNRRAPLTLDRGQAWLVHKTLDADAMHDAAQALVGNHDFTTFRSVQCQAKSPVKTVDEISVSRYADEIEIVCRARSFLHNQVRSFVGTLKMVGDGSWTRRKVEKALAAKDRAACGPVAPPDGLYLLQVDYE
ncbi:tRNA pseudouridine synthase A [Parvibaculum lavamentivorans DS-1]|uniref:tRNA pseudouridine synthase A n=1 Tax=Parvibaculum lavamentivorans (strain DS-1 / DSM 13023 / NCIMB 13966) TaxID=402881 RepID=TRUA_PARL1|nr:tRNA pseudouridine(38-40) synthase TruA [Parvibaculum lavamentivorans]A7HPQ3.1 RecName: Full=tRNA pseudouridine synthase A; AltName: Full=tRNA pseudouridine(38-40) synthase; AltName: Full=tRNA pseudouridylate synthase I; AltName: Full=tRNA-uridine isomerase I [Parvibaculum lavamentivorans DS-1]ABS61886.1 tRNA pseudouridine synthase A [Parvibaculum lavamentivorans DS-1]